MTRHQSSVVITSEHERLAEIITDLRLPPDWRVTIERRRRKTLGIEIWAGGVVTVAVPENLAEEDIATLLAGHVDRVARAVARHRGVEAAHPAKELVDGEHFDYLGRTYRLRVVTGAEFSAQLIDDWLELVVIPGDKPTAGRLIDWYAACGEELIEDAMPMLARAAGLPTPTTMVRDLGAKWGLRERGGRISIHWATFQLPADLIELVLAHELTHLRVSTHSEEFWRELGRLVPDFALRERRLAVLGASAWLGAVRHMRL
ncbi:YgjP-like metallopeptidase domain-containing protein [Nocardia sp. SYP-A9097]|uniref:M48 family metallopeptidase n=1 Tax=Nocardia sp. SYP-A9097 TaxID=2663237 RepID=UPI00129A5B3B|nr:YgjP-like metallopeptidase domain-containing protein [Nocardia sp. SYP-A9097]